jgi:hypothetical protein
VSIKIYARLWPYPPANPRPAASAPGQARLATWAVTRIQQFREFCWIALHTVKPSNPQSGRITNQPFVMGVLAASVAALAAADRMKYLALGSAGDDDCAAVHSSGIPALRRPRFTDFSRSTQCQFPGATRQIVEQEYLSLAKFMLFLRTDPPGTHVVSRPR